MIDEGFRVAGFLRGSLSEGIKSTRMKATDLLKKDHDAVRGLLSKCEDSSDQAHQKRSAQAQPICETLLKRTAHEDGISLLSMVNIIVPI
jgi:hypothetical protein